jgi:hypothetical protein
MPKIYPLNKILSVNTTYEMEKDRYFVIKKIGTNVSADVIPKVDGNPCGKIINTIAPLHKTSSNLLEPLDLGRLYISVPPERKIVFESTGSGKVRIIGDLIVLSPGESLLPEHKSRYDVQGKNYVTYITGTYTLTGGASWPDGIEYTVITLTPKTIEDYLLKSFVGASVTNLSATLAEGQVSIRFFLDDVPLDQLLSAPGQFGIDALSMPLPPTATTEFIPFTLENYPINVPGDHTLTIKARNTSGGTLSPATGQNITITVTAISEYLRKD